MTKLTLLFGSALIIGFWAAAWFHPGWGLLGVFVLALALWLLTRDAPAPAAQTATKAEADPTTQPTSLPPADERRAWAELPPAVRERLGHQPAPGHQIWAGVRPDPAGEPRTEWRVVSPRGEVVQAFWLDAP